MMCTTTVGWYSESFAKNYGRKKWILIWLRIGSFSKIKKFRVQAKVWREDRHWLVSIPLSEREPKSNSTFFFHCCLKSWCWMKIYRHCYKIHCPSFTEILIIATAQKDISSRGDYIIWWTGDQHFCIYFVCARNVVCVFALDIGYFFQSFKKLRQFL